MRYMKMLIAILTAVVLMAFAGTASATVLTSPAGTNVPVGMVIKATAEGGVSWDGSINLTCSTSTMEGEVTNAGGPTSTVVVSLSNLTFTHCSKDTYITTRLGSLVAHSTGSGNGTLTSTGTEITVQLHRTIIFPHINITTHCIYITNNTHIGTFTGSSTTKGTATLEIGSAPIPQVATDGACGDDAVLTGNYQFTSPDSLDVD